MPPQKRPIIINQGVTPPTLPVRYGTRISGRMLVKPTIGKILPIRSAIESFKDPILVSQYYFRQTMTIFITWKNI
jgi:hypothetical protein